MQSKAAGLLKDEIVDAAKGDLPRAGARVFRTATAGAVSFALGDVVELEDDDDEDEAGGGGLPLLGLVQALFRGGEPGAEAEVQVRVMVHGEETVLGDAASAHELFVTDALLECPVSAVRGTRRAQHLRVPAGHGAARDEAIAAVRALLEGNEAAAAAGRPIQMLYRMLYLPQEGMFRLLPEDLRAGCYLHEAEERSGLKDAGGAFMCEGQQYRVGDFVYLLAQCDLHPSPGPVLFLRVLCKTTSVHFRTLLAVWPVCNCAAYRSKRHRGGRRAPSKASKDSGSDEDDAEVEAAPVAAKKAPAKARGKRKRGAKAGSGSDDENDADFVVAKKVAAAGVGGAKPAARRAPTSKGPKADAAPAEGAEAVAAVGADEDAEKAKLDPWMEKYQKHDLGRGKGDLGGLTPYTVAQIVSVSASRKGSRGAPFAAMQSRDHKPHDSAPDLQHAFAKCSRAPHRGLQASRPCTASRSGPLRGRRT